MLFLHSCVVSLQWQKEVDRLEVQQKARLGDVISKVRQELVDYWNKCMFGPAQKETFNVHFCDGEYWVYQVWVSELAARHPHRCVKSSPSL